MLFAPQQRRRREFELQSAIIRWAQLRTGAFPELRLLYHVPNGGSRHRIEAANLRRIGVSPGVPDLHLPVARGPYHGLWIEAKSATGRVTLEQRRWIDSLRLHGHCVAIVRGVTEAIREIETYLRL